MARLLVIDDEPEICRFVERALASAGHHVTSSHDGVTGLQLASERMFDLIVLDLAMPDVDGMMVLAAVLARDPLQRVIVLSARGSVDVRVACLERGAVDFVAKPFAVRELLARVEARLSEHRDAAVPATIRAGRLVLDFRRRSVSMDGVTTVLSQREFLLLQYLMRRSGLVCTREELLSEVWGYGFDPGSNVVDVCVRRLRAKVDGNLIRTVRNVGTSSSRRDLGRLVDLTTALVVCVLLLVMVLMPAQETLPYHALFLCLTIVYGFRVWPMVPTLAVIGGVMVTTGAIFVQRWSNELIEAPELFEIVLMPALLLAMVWHARRRDRAEKATAAMAENLRLVLERERAFLSDSSHAIRTPVTIARGHVDLLIPELDGIAKADAEVVLRQLNRMERLSGRLLSLAQLQRGEVLAPRPLDADHFVEEVALAWRTVERAWEVSVASTATVRADPEWLHMALDALIENALKHTDSGDTIAVSCRLRDQSVVLSVDDSGPGVPLADRPHVFERFWHRRSAGRLNGSGLGLSMVRAVAEAHGGRAEVGQSAAGGARFTIVLPAMSPQVARPEKVTV